MSTEIRQNARFLTLLLEAPQSALEVLSLGDLNL